MNPPVGFNHFFFLDAIEDLLGLAHDKIPDFVFLVTTGPLPLYALSTNGGYYSSSDFCLFILFTKSEAANQNIRYPLIFSYAPIRWKPSYSSGFPNFFLIIQFFL